MLKSSSEQLIWNFLLLTPAKLRVDNHSHIQTNSKNVKEAHSTRISEPNVNAVNTTLLSRRKKVQTDP